MPCYRPNLILFDTRTTPFKKLRFVSANSKDFVGYEYFDAENKFLESLQNNYHRGERWIRVPCGQCAGCREAKSREWAVRCMLEAEQYPDRDGLTFNWHITLTYDEDTLPRYDEIINKRTGEFKDADNENGILRYSDFQDFKKRLLEHWRFKYNWTGIKFYMCGEYGGQTQRPHYHCIFFNMPLDPSKLKIHAMNKDGPIYLCDEIQKIWNKGFISITEVSWDICAYVARYVMKKRYGSLSQDEYFDASMVPEFTHMSNRQAIGKKFFDKNFQMIYANDEIILKGHACKIQRSKPPKYYDKLFKDIYPDDYKVLADKRKRSVELNNKLKLNNTTLTERDYLKVLERQKKDQLSCFNLQRTKF